VAAFRILLPRCKSGSCPTMSVHHHTVNPPNA
jgi:hypothetical protein